MGPRGVVLGVLDAGVIVPVTFFMGEDVVGSERHQEQHGTDDSGQRHGSTQVWPEASFRFASAAVWRCRGMVGFVHNLAGLSQMRTPDFSIHQEERLESPTSQGMRCLGCKAALLRAESWCGKAFKPRKTGSTALAAAQKPHECQTTVSKSPGQCME